MTKNIEPVQELTVDEKIDSDYYEPKLEYVPRSKDPVAYDVYRVEEQRLDEEFKFDALREVGLKGHPKADKIYSLAWQKGHAMGYSEVLGELRDLAELFNDDD